MRSSLEIPLKNIKIHVATNDTKESIIKRSNPCVMKLIIIYGDINEDIETNITLTITSLKNIRIDNPIILCSIIKRTTRQRIEIKIVA